MAAKNRVHFKAEEMEQLLNAIANAASCLSIFCDDVEKPIGILTSDELLSGDDTDNYKTTFREIKAGADNAKNTVHEIQKLCNELASAMQLALRTVNKSSQQAIDDMKKVSNKVKESATAE